MKKALLSIFIIGLCFGLFPVQAMSKTVDFKFEHHLPPMLPMHTKVLVPWAEKLKSQSGGQINISLKGLSKNVIGGKGLGSVQKGDIDITLLIPTMEYSEKFPLTTFMSLPFLIKDAEKGSILYWQVYQKYMQEEYKDVKVLWLSCTSPNMLHTIDKPIKSISDIKGLKISAEKSKIFSKVITILGAQPIDTSLSFQALNSNTIDSVFAPLELVWGMNLYKKLRSHTIMSFQVVPIAIVMNKEKYKSLPTDLQKIFDENIGEKMGVRMGQVFDKLEKNAIDFVEKDGGVVNIIPDKEIEALKKLTMPIGEEWIAKMETKGLPGQDVLESAVEILMQIQ